MLKANCHGTDLVNKTTRKNWLRQASVKSVIREINIMIMI